METLKQWPYKTYNRGRWENDLGTMNLIDKAAVRRGVQAIEEFEFLAVGALLRSDDIGLNPDAFSHEMVQVGKYTFGPEEEPVQSASDRICVAIHGMTNSHMDAFSHLGHKGISFNGALFDDIVSMDGASRFPITDLSAVVTRAWFVDVPRQRGLPFLRPGDPVVPSDLAHLEEVVEPGDAVLVRTGRYAAEVVKPDDPRAKDDHGNWSGLHVECMDLIHSWDLATVATDSSGDNFPSTTDKCSVPIHIIAEAYIGMPLIHHLNLEDLGSRFATRKTKACLFCVGPLLVPGATGSPVNPVVVI